MPQALVVGAGPGLSASVARKLARRGHDVTLAARDPSDLSALAEEIGGRAVAANAREPDDMARLLAGFDDLAVAVYNPSARTRASIEDLTPEQAENALMVSAFGAYLMAHHAVPLMKARGSGALLFTGASAGIKGFPNSAAFAMGKFALRGLASRSRASCTRRTSMSATSSSTAPSTRRAEATTRGWTPTPSPTHTCTSSISTAPPGAGKWK